MQFADSDSLDRAARAIDSVGRDDDALTLQVPSDGGVAAMRAVFDRLDADAVEIVGLTVHTPDLDDVFLYLTGQTKELQP